MSKWPGDDVILFDGVCIVCSRWVGFVARRETIPVHADPVGLWGAIGAHVRHQSG